MRKPLLIGNQDMRHTVEALFRKMSLKRSVSEGDMVTPSTEEFNQQVSAAENRQSSEAALLNSSGTEVATYNTTHATANTSLVVEPDITRSSQHSAARGADSVATESALSQFSEDAFAISASSRTSNHITNLENSANFAAINPGLLTPAQSDRLNSGPTTSTAISPQVARFLLPFEEDILEFADLPPIADIDDTFEPFPITTDEDTLQALPIASDDDIAEQLLPAVNLENFQEVPNSLNSKAALFTKPSITATPSRGTNNKALSTSPARKFTSSIKITDFATRQTYIMPPKMVEEDNNTRPASALASSPVQTPVKIATPKVRKSKPKAKGDEQDPPTEAAVQEPTRPSKRKKHNHEVDDDIAISEPDSESAMINTADSPTKITMIAASELAKLRSRVASLQQNNEAFVKENVKLKQKLSELKECEDKAMVYETENARLERLVEGLSTENEGLEGDKRELEREVRRLQANFE